IGAAFIPDDGHIDPYSLTQAYAKGIKANGGRIIEGVMVTELVRMGGRISQVVTNHGTIDVDTVVNAAGLWARQVGWMAGVELPAGVVEHQYLVTEKCDRMPEGIPAFRDPDGGYYAKPEPGALVIGGWEKATSAVNPIEGFPWDCANHLFASNMDRLEEILEPAARRFPLLNELGIRNIVNGPIPISPDGEPVMGPVPGISNFFAACAFTSGIAASGGAGKAMVNWILHGDPGLDLWAFDVRRFGPLQAGPRFLHDRALESYRKYYAVHWPGEEQISARGVRRSPLYDTLRQQGAVFGSKFGWERANWFAQGNIPPHDVHGFDRPQQEITIGREHRAARDGVVLIDQSSFTKFEISGRDACRFLQYLTVANVDKTPGGATYAQLCNERGGIEADVTIMRRADDQFWLITGSGNGIRDRQWMEQHAVNFTDVTIRDISSAYGVINLAGPKARDVLQSVCDDDVSHDRFSFMTTRDIRIGYAPAVAYRVTYIGELGWELYIPMEYMQYAYETLLKAGQGLGITNIGYRAIDSLRLEKRYLAWGTDITPDNNPFEAGLQFLIDWQKGDFMGAEALSRIRDEGVGRKLTCLVLDDPLPVFGGEAILCGGSVVGQTTSGNFGYTIGNSLVLGYLPKEILEQNSFEIESFGQRSTATAISGPAYDPQRKKILC
ncbi:MAG: GcvT family protein, partial [Alphaproteobacteria bacterium]|nr:GcvT family protein [Alphaproteobacteria bacterium]